MYSGTDMGVEEEAEDDGLYLENIKPQKISLYQQTAEGALESGNREEARELYQEALTEVHEYRDNINEIRDKATLSEEDRRHLEEMEAQLDELEEGLKTKLNQID